MNTSVNAETHPDVDTSARAWAVALVVGTIVFAVAILLDYLRTTNTDASWLMTVAERVLAGERLYIDVIETNPPMAVWLYYPPILLAHHVGGDAESWLRLQYMSAIAVSLLACAWFGRGTTVLGNPRHFVLAGVFSLAILPLSAFGQREHMAVIAILPLLVTLAARAEGRSPTLFAVFAAGIGAGLSVTIKPHFALAVALPVLWLAWHRRSWRSIFAPEAGLAALIAVVYVAIVFVAFPYYRTDLLPLLLEVYRPAKKPLLELLVNWPVGGIVLPVLAGIVVTGWRAMRPLDMTLLWAALGFAIAFIEQGKGWGYHLLPATALVAIYTLTSGLAVVADAARGFRRIAAVGSILLLSVGMPPLKAIEDDVRQSAAIVGSVGKAPKIGIIGSHLGIGHPLIRMVGGHLVNRTFAQWLSTSAIWRIRLEQLSPAVERRMMAVIDEDRAALLEDLRRQPPDVIVVEKFFAEVGYISASPELVAFLDDYAEIGQTPLLRILARRKAVAAL